MKITGITTCVGPIYAATLAKILPTWMGTLDSLIVVTDPNHQLTETIQAHSDNGRLQLVTTDAFFADGAFFNKGRALNDGVKLFPPDREWIVHFDSDMLPPENWRTFVESRIQMGRIYGATRRRQRTVKRRPIGFFQLWHMDDPAVADFPLFKEEFKTAAAYDIHFIDRWSLRNQVILPLFFQDLEPKSHWHGPNNDHLDNLGRLRIRNKKARQLPRRR